MFSNILSVSLLACFLSIPVSASIGSHAPAILRRHHELALRSDGDVELFKRFSGARWSFYNTETGNAGSCGHFLTNGGFTVAVNQAQMNSGFCGKTIRMTYGGRSTTATVQDTCPGCPYAGLDLSPGLFSFFADQGAGIIYGEWEFTDGSGAPPPPPPPKPTTHKVTPTSTWHPPPSTSSKPRPTSTSHSSSSTSKSSVSSTATIDYLSGPASGLAIPTGTVPQGQTSNLETLNQIFVQMGGIVVAGANI
ncbi:hypothetical protein GALMADRAFT_249089 [Galerina marginata CBS 339.88]|uniref:RlpA-like protein double-psi beta-barrel domain-containing protein n=1 Tax=Galerina marginata (strain CBS 339.88) TaxID=685588 RepID=A0A067T5F2_GALM3|nr:hypothetical protein GALMADRAFT_249089 [Galerina marginata CBS 339.88]